VVESEASQARTVDLNTPTAAPWAFGKKLHFSKTPTALPWGIFLPEEIPCPLFLHSGTAM
jgi:hypothetical protein